MTKQQTIRPVDARQYIDYQFQGLADTLEAFDFNGMAKVVRAAQNVFQKIEPDSHVKSTQDYTLSNFTDIK